MASQRHYELMAIFHPDLLEKDVKDQINNYLKIVKEGDFKVDYMGPRKLAYEIKHNSEGIYVVVDLHITPEISKELERQLGLNENILRIKILKIED